MNRRSGFRLFTATRGRWGINQSERDVRAAEFIRALLGKTLDVSNVEVHPPTATSEPVITVDDDVYRALDERAARSGMNVQQLLEAGLGAAMLLGELNDTPEA